MKMIRNKNVVSMAKLPRISQTVLPGLGAALRSRKACRDFIRNVCERTGSLLKRTVLAREPTHLSGLAYQRLRDRASASVSAFSLDDAA